MGNEPWALWRLLGVRAPGFSITELLKLAMPVCAAAADRIIAEEENGHREQEPLWQAAWDNFQAAFNVASIQTSAALYDVTQTATFQEAVIWQNRHAFHNMIKRLARPPVEGLDLSYRNSQQRRREETTAIYWQRYCSKNETIGFFGPVGWGKFAPSGDSISVKPGPHLLAKRRVYFEEWGISLLAKKLSQDRKLRPWIAPQRHPFIHAGATSVRLPNVGQITFSTEEVSILQLCDGRRLAREIAADLANQIHQAVVYEILERLDTQGLISWSLRIPIETNPEEILRAQIARVEDDDVRAPALAKLTELEQSRMTVAQAAGDPQRLDQALNDLEATFIRLTGEEATRLSGKMFAGRTLVYEDCVRDLDTTLGPDLRDAMAGPLTLLFTSARWFSWRLATIYRDLFQKLYTEAVERTGKRTIPVLALWDQLAPFLSPNPPFPALQNLYQELHQHWTAILSPLPEQHRLSSTTAELRSQLLGIFAAPGPGWTRSQYTSVDILIDATDVESIQRGEYQLVVGDFHPTNPLLQPFHLYQHPQPTEIERDFNADLPDRQFIPTFASGGPYTPRVSYGIQRPNDIWFRMVPDACVNPKLQSLDLGEILLEAPDNGGAVQIRTRDGRLSADPVAFFEFAPFRQMLMNYRLFGDEAHIPRITVDRVVIHRESWQVSAADISFAKESDEAKRFVAARRWAHENEMPRFVFAKLPHEGKPFYVDFDSPIFVNILAKEIRASEQALGSNARITITEMLPTPNGAWLPDAEGRRYTSELRLIALDLMPHQS